ncbi:MAG: DNA gyrase subunit A [Paludibacteraceae bacterium]|nr:DNA gyrase subunit A [Paludibacteraceae bacterium]
MEQIDRIIKVDIEEEMKSSYIDYSMSVIVSRALPDVRDGLKPAHRRVLFGMNELGLAANKPTRKSAGIVGEVLGNYHPHGDTAVYGTLTRMAQDWIMRYPLVFGQGNFGSVDGDPPAAMRYTEARMQKIAEDMLIDIDKDTVDMKNTFDDRKQEPVVLPTRIPNLLLNGASGIAVGMATNIAPHNLSEVIDATCAYIDDNDIDTEGLMRYVKAPDFPTGGIIYNYSGVKEAFDTGRGRIIIRSKAEIETDKDGKTSIIISEIPYQVNKSELIKQISDLVKLEKIQGIADINDESGRREKLRIVIEVKRDANANVILNKLYKYSELQSSFSVNNVALVKGRPQTLSLKDMIKYFVEHRHEVVVRRTKFNLAKAEKRAHILSGLIIATDNIDEVVRIIRASKKIDEARQNLMNRFDFSELQAQAIVEMRLGALTGLSIEDLHAEYDEIQKLIADLNQILGSVERQMAIVKEELIEIKEKYGDERCSQINFSGDHGFNQDEMYADDDMVITISHSGYIKRTPLTEFRTQNRGGVGSKGSQTRDEDFIEYIYTATMRSTMLFFTQKGRCFWLKVYEIPEGTKQTKGRAIQNILNIEPDDKVNAFISIKQLNDIEFTKSHNLIFATKQGIVKKTSLEAYSRPRVNGVNAITIKDDDRVVQVCLTDGQCDILLANRNGRAIRFPESKVREMGRTATGVRGMTLDGDGDEIVGMIALSQEAIQNDTENVLVLSEQGFGKRSELADYRITNRGGKGVKTINITEKTGKLVSINRVTDENDIMIINKSGMTLRMKVEDLRILGRATQGVKFIELKKRNDEIASICVVPVAEEEDVEESVENGIEIVKEESQD